MFTCAITLRGQKDCDVVGGESALRPLRLLFSKRVNKPASGKRNDLPREALAVRATASFKSLQLLELLKSLPNPRRALLSGKEEERKTAEGWKVTETQQNAGEQEEEEEGEPRRNEEWEGEALLVLISRNAELGLISGGQTSPARTSGAPFVFQRGGRLSAAAHISQGHVWLFCTSQISASDDILSRGSGGNFLKKSLILGNTLSRRCEGQGGGLCGDLMG